MKKDIEWLKKVFDDLFNGKSILTVGRSVVDEILNQLDEPETLSQELPVIPKFVADWIESRKNNYPSDVIGAYLRMNELSANEQTREVLSWVHESELNRSNFARAWLDGFTVEEEQRYVVELPNPNSQMGRHKNVFLNKKEGKVFIDSASLFVNDITKYGQSALTEEEIKKDFEWAWKFAVKVEEMEE